MYREYPWVRGEEEGVAIIVKSRLGSDASSTQRISNTNTVLLPRMLNDARYDAMYSQNFTSPSFVCLSLYLYCCSDDHQRVLLHAEVEVTSHAQDGSSRRLLYDVYTSHLRYFTLISFVVMKFNAVNFCCSVIKVLASLLGIDRLTP